MDHKPMTPEELREITEQFTKDADFLARNAEYEKRRQLVFQDEARRPVIPNVDLGVVWMSPEIERSSFKYQRRMLAAPMKVQVTAIKEGEKAEARAAKLSRFFNRHHQEWMAQGAYDGALFDQASVGAGVLRLSIDVDRIEGIKLEASPSDGESVTDYTKRIAEVLKERRGSIFKLESVDYATIYHSPGDERTCVVHVSRVPVKPLSAKYGRPIYYTKTTGAQRELVVGSPGTGMPDEAQISLKDKVELIVVEDGEYCYHMLGDESGNTRGRANLVGVYRNYFGRPGFVVFGGDTTRDPRPLRRYRSLVQGMYQAVPMENIMGSLRLAAGVKAGQMQYALEPLDADSALPDGAVEIRVEDGVIIPPEGYRIAAPKLDVGFDLLDSFNISREMTKDFGFPVVLDKPEEVTATAGYDRALQQDTVSNLLDTPLANWGEAVREVFLMMAHAIKELPLPVVIRAVRQGDRVPELANDVAEDISVEGADVEEIDLSVTFDSITSYTRIGLLEENLKLLEAGQLTQTELQRSRGIDDIQAWRRMQQREQMTLTAMALADKYANMAVEKLISVMIGGIFADNGVDPSVSTEAGFPPPGDVSGALEAGPSIPTGAGTAMPVVPPVPSELEDAALSGMQQGVSVGI